MCKQHTIIYACGHGFELRLSTCNARKTINDSKNTWRACQGLSYLTRSIANPCKQCYFKGKRLEIELLAEDLRCGTIDQEVPLSVMSMTDLDEIDAWECTSIEELAKSLPRCEPTPKRPLAEAPTWNSRHKSGRTKSLLSTVVRAEDVVGHWGWETNLAHDGDTVNDTPITDVWEDASSDEGWAGPGEPSMVTARSESSDESEDELILEVSAIETVAEIKPENEDNYLAGEQVPQAWVTGTSWGSISIV